MAPSPRRRTPAQIAADRAKIAGLLLEGYSQNAIAVQTGISQPHVHREIKQIYALWTESALVDFDKVKARELAKIDKLEAFYWECIRKDLEPKITRTSRVKGVTVPESELDKLILTESGIIQKRAKNKLVPTEKEVTETTRTTNVNPAYLAGIERCIQMRARIYGFDRPQGNTGQMPDLTQFFSALQGTLPSTWEEE